MTNLVPLRSMLNSLNRWPSIWEDEDMQLMSSPFANDIDVYETDTNVVVKANVAGVGSDDIEVTFEKGTLWVRAKATEEEKDKKNKYYAKASWDYSYKIAVPGDIDHRKDPEVTLDSGVLTVKFHKSEESKPKKLTIKKK